MAELATRRHSAGTDAAFDLFERAVLEAAAGKGSYRDGTAFIATDMPNFAGVLRRYLDAGKPIVLVYPDGREVRISPRRRSRR